MVDSNQVTIQQLDWNVLFNGMIVVVLMVGMARLISGLFEETKELPEYRSLAYHPQTKLTEEQLAGDREPISFTPVRRLQRDDLLYVIEELVPHPIEGYYKAHKEYSVIDLRGYRKGYEPRLDIQGVYTPNPKDTFRLQDGHLPPYQPTTSGDKLLNEMRRAGVHKAYRIAPIYSAQTEARPAYLPHPATTQRTIAATELRPAYKVPPGIYDWGYVTAISPQSAENATMYAHALHYLPLSCYRWQYTQVPLWKIDQDDRWYSTMAKFLYYTPGEVDEAMAARSFPLSDYAILCEEGKFYEGRELSREEEEDAYFAFGYWLKRNIKRCRWIYAEIVAFKSYYPPVLSHDYSTLNGAHRVAVLWKEFGPDFKVWAWLMQG